MVCSSSCDRALSPNLVCYKTVSPKVVQISWFGPRLHRTGFVIDLPEHVLFLYASQYRLIRVPYLRYGKGFVCSNLKQTSLLIDGTENCRFCWISAFKLLIFLWLIVSIRKCSFMFHCSGVAKFLSRSLSSCVAYFKL